MCKVYILKIIFTMKIAYLSIDDPKDYISWSGLKLNIYKTLKNLGHEIKIVGPFKDKKRLPFIAKRELLKLFNYKYDSERKFFLSKIYAKKINTFIFNNKIDLIFTSDSYLISHLKTNIPIILWLDVTYKTYFNHYFNNNKIHNKSFKEANDLEKLALHKAKKIILTSKWSKDETVKNYNINPKKVEIIPFGSNLKKNKVIKRINKKDNLNLVSIGVDWERKGMDKTIKITEYLNKQGLNTRLNIIGSSHNKKKFPKYINQVGFLDKNKKKEHSKIIKILSNADFHILMTKKEACGVVFAEANSCGIYNITNDVGGVRGMIKNNINGKLFKLNDSESKIAKYIIKIFKNKKKLFELKKRSLKYYKEKLNWNANSSKLQIILSKAKK